MLISYENAIKAMENVKSHKINIKETIKNTQKSCFLNDKEYYCQAINFQDMLPTDFRELMDENFTEDNYFNKVFEYLEKDNGIYIALTYLCESSKPDSDCFVLDDGYFDDDSIEYDGFEAIVDYFYIDNAYKTVHIEYPIKYGLSFDMASDYGINIKKEGDDYKIRFGHRKSSSCGSCMGVPGFYEFDVGSMTDQNSLANPINQLMILLMEKVIVFDG